MTLAKMNFMQQITNSILMIRPVRFEYNAQTATDNLYQQKEAEDVHLKALKEFDDFVSKLKSAGVNIMVIEDTLEPHTPDSIFPNNWISLHEDGKLGLYPMYAENRRTERRKDIIDLIQQQASKPFEIIDYTTFEKEGKFLEGTGSLVLDREHKIAYASLSKRTDKSLTEKFCKDFGFTPVFFHSEQTIDGKLYPIYHTNVMMCVTEKSAIVCFEVIKDAQERESLRQSLVKTGKNIIEITEQQVNHFAGNMLQVSCKLARRSLGEVWSQVASLPEVDLAKSGRKPLLVMSQQAFKSLHENQIAEIEKESEILHSPLYTIEKNGGGSARCMMCEVFFEVESQKSKVKSLEE